VPSWQPLTPEDRAHYDKLFSEAQSTQSAGNQLKELWGGREAVQFLMASGLSRDALHEIWGLCDPANTGILDRPGFYCCLRLVAMVQNGFDASVDLLHSLSEQKLPYPILQPASPSSQADGNPFEKLAQSQSPSNQPNPSADNFYSSPDQEEDFGDFTTAPSTEEATAQKREPEVINNDPFAHFFGDTPESNVAAEAPAEENTSKDKSFGEFFGAEAGSKSNPQPDNEAEANENEESFGEFLGVASDGSSKLNEVSEDWGDFTEMPKPVMMNNEETQKNKLSALFELVESDLKAQEEDWDDFVDGDEGFEANFQSSGEDKANEGDSKAILDDTNGLHPELSKDALPSQNTENHSAGPAVNGSNSLKGEAEDEWSAFENPSEPSAKDVPTLSQHEEWDAFGQIQNEVEAPSNQEEEWDAFQDSSQDKTGIPQPAPLESHENDWDTFEELPNRASDQAMKAADQNEANDEKARQPVNPVDQVESTEKREGEAGKEGEWAFKEPLQPTTKPPLLPTEVEEEEWSAFQEPDNSQPSTSEDSKITDLKKDGWDAFEQLSRENSFQQPPKPTEKSEGSLKKDTPENQQNEETGSTEEVEEEWAAFEEPGKQQSKVTKSQKEGWDASEETSVENVNAPPLAKDEPSKPAATMTQTDLKTANEMESEVQKDPNIKEISAPNEDEWDDFSSAKNEEDEIIHIDSTKHSGTEGYSSNITAEEGEDPAWIEFSEPATSALVPNNDDEDETAIPTDDLLFFGMDSSYGSRKDESPTLNKDTFQGQQAGLQAMPREDNFTSFSESVEGKDEMNGTASTEGPSQQVDAEPSLPKPRRNNTRPAAKKHAKGRRTSSSETHHGIGPIADKLLESLVASYCYEEAIQYYEHIEACRRIEEQNKAKAAAVADDQFELAIEIRERIRLLQSKKVSDMTINSWRKVAAGEPKPSLDAMATEVMALDVDAGAQFISLCASSASYFTGNRGLGKEEGYSLDWLWQGLKARRPLAHSFRLFKLLRGPCKEYPSNQWRQVLEAVEKEVQQSTTALQDLITACQSSPEELKNMLSTPKFEQFFKGLVEMMNVTRRIEASSESAFVQLSTDRLECAWATFSGIAAELKIAVDEKVTSIGKINQTLIDLPISSSHFLCNLCLQPTLSDERCYFGSSKHGVCYCNACANLWVNRISPQLYNCIGNEV